MKKFILSCLVLLSLSQLNANIITVTVTNNQYTPANFNCTVGDTVRYNCIEGIHNAFSGIFNTISGVVPAGAPQIFSGAVQNITWTYDYVVVVPGDYRYYCQIHTFDGINGHVGRFTASAVFPAELTNFTARLENKTVAVSWQTLTEQNVNYFAVKRSFNGLEFTELGRVKATGNSTTLQSYRFTDNGLEKAGAYIYYSLATVDQDGTQSLSQIVMVKNPAAPKKLIASLSPNPVSKTGHLMLQFNAGGTDKLFATVYDATGKKIMQDVMSSVAGINNGHLDLGNVSTGTYIIVFTLGKQRETHRVVIQ